MWVKKLSKLDIFDAIFGGFFISYLNNLILTIDLIAVIKLHEEKRV